MAGIGLTTASMRTLAEPLAGEGPCAQRGSGLWRGQSTAPWTGQRQEAVFWVGVLWLWLVLRWARSLQAEAEGHHTGRNATYKAEDGDAAWRGRSQSSRGWEDRGTTVSPWGARGGWEGKVSGRSLG